MDILVLYRLYSQAMRLLIEITRKQHEKLQASAALHGRSVQDYVLERVLPADGEETALRELEDFLQPRIVAAKRGEWSDRTATKIFDSARERDSQD